MDFSQVAGEDLVELVANLPTPPTASRVKWGGSWHCPAGWNADARDGWCPCTRCGKHSVPPHLLYDLAESPVHR
jgi:hypothetical protein